MKVVKKVISDLNKCYSIAPLKWNGQDFFLVAAEKEDRCILFDLEGEKIDTVWNGPGGVMSMVQVPGSNGQFLATHKFYSPNDSKQAEIVFVSPDQAAGWTVRTLVKLPHVHRFDIIQRNGVDYLIVCTLKSGHEYKDDWSSPGKVYAAVLPKNLDLFDKNNQLELHVIKDDMLKNHGYCRTKRDNIMTSIISAECGVFEFIPPEHKQGSWEIRQLLTTAASDAVMFDFDEDGELEMAVLSPFHGDKVSIYKKKDGLFCKVYEYKESIEFLHALYAGRLLGKPALVVGHRKANRKLLVFFYDKEKQTYQAHVIDTDCGPANVYHFEKNGKDILVSANRETNEVAVYTLFRSDSCEPA